MLHSAVLTSDGWVMPTTKDINIYLAGPEVFLPDPVTRGADKHHHIERFNREVLSKKSFRFVGCYPLDVKIEDYSDTPRTAMKIFRNCIEMMDKSDLIIANITHFRGPSADVGTVFEMGYMYAQQKPVFVYYNVQETYGIDQEVSESNEATPRYDAHTLYGDKVRSFASGYFVDRSTTADRDNDNLLIESFGLTDNLMLICGARSEIDKTGNYAPADSFLAALQEAADYIVQQKDSLR